jgi:hypothetical protein
MRRPARDPRNRALADIVAAGEFGKGRALGPPPPCFGLLCVGQLRGSAHVLPALLGRAAALGGAGADKVALDVGEAAQHGNHQAPGAGAGVGPRLDQLYCASGMASVSIAREWRAASASKPERGAEDRSLHVDAVADLAAARRDVESAVADAQCHPRLQGVVECAE